MSKIRYIMWWIYKLSHVFATRERERLGREMIGWSEKERKKGRGEIEDRCFGYGLTAAQFTLTQFVRTMNS